MLLLINILLSLHIFTNSVPKATTNANLFVQFLAYGYKPINNLQADIKEVTSGPNGNVGRPYNV